MGVVWSVMRADPESREGGDVTTLADSTVMDLIKTGMTSTGSGQGSN